MIDPWAILPERGLERLQAYWYASLCRGVYLRDLERVQALFELAGPATGMILPDLNAPIPAAQLWRYAGGRIVLIVEGTTEWQQYVLQAQGSLLAVTPPYPGRVSLFWAAAAAVIFHPIEAEILENGGSMLALGGHSMGGGIAMLLAARLEEIPAVFVRGLYSLGAPRVGDGSYAAGQTMPHCRLTNRGDPVPLLPPSLNQPVDTTLLNLWPMLPTSYRHWGQRFHLDVDGAVYLPEEMSTWQEGSEALLGVVTSDRAWYDGHSTEEYARRLRIGIPVALGEDSPDYPGINVIDEWWSELTGRPLEQLWPELPACPQLR